MPSIQLSICIAFCEITGVPLIIYDMLSMIAVPLVVDIVDAIPVPLDTSNPDTYDEFAPDKLSVVICGCPMPIILIDFPFIDMP
jgi:hypothetical protein